LEGGKERKRLGAENIPGKVAGTERQARQSRSGPMRERSAKKLNVVGASGSVKEHGGVDTFRRQIFRKVCKGEPQKAPLNGNSMRRSLGGGGGGGLPHEKKTVSGKKTDMSLGW